MEYKNNTEKNVLTQLRHGKIVWENLNKDLPIKLILVKEGKSDYAIFNKHKIHTGAFIPANFINEEEVKELGWEIK